MADRFGSPMLIRVAVASATTSWALAARLPVSWALPFFGALFFVCGVLVIVVFYAKWRPHGSENWWAFSRPITWSGFMAWVMPLPSSQTRFPLNEREALIERAVLVGR